MCNSKIGEVSSVHSSSLTVQNIMYINIIMYTTEFLNVISRSLISLSVVMDI